jgi:hypothetical protein
MHQEEKKLQSRCLFHGTAAPGNDRQRAQRPCWQVRATCSLLVLVSHVTTLAPSPRSLAAATVLVGSAGAGAGEMDVIRGGPPDKYIVDEGDVLSRAAQTKLNKVLSRVEVCLTKWTLHGPFFSALTTSVCLCSNAPATTCTL